MPLEPYFVALLPADFGLLEPHLQSVELPRRKELVRSGNKRIDHAPIESGFVSVVANGSTRPGIEIAHHRARRHDRLVRGVGKQTTALRTTPICKWGQWPTCCSKPSRRHHAERGSTTCFCGTYAHSSCKPRRPRLPTAAARSRNGWRGGWMAQDRIDGDQLPPTHEFLL